MADILQTRLSFCILLNEIITFSLSIGMKFVLGGLIDAESALVQVVATRLIEDNPWSEAMMTVPWRNVASVGRSDLRNACVVIVWEA